MLINKKTYKIVAIITLCMCNALHCGVGFDGAPVDGNTKTNESDSNIGNPKDLILQELKPNLPEELASYILELSKKEINCPPPAPRLSPLERSLLEDGQEPAFLLPTSEHDTASNISNTEGVFKDQDALQSMFSPQLSAALQSAKT